MREQKWMRERQPWEVATKARWEVESPEVVNTHCLYIFRNSFPNTLPLIR